MRTGFTACQQFQHQGRVFKADYAAFQPPVNGFAQGAVNTTVAQQLTLPVFKHIIRTRQHPVRRALKDMQMSNIGRYGRNNLCGTGTAADNRDPFTFIVVIVIPVIGVESFSLKAVAAFKLRNHRGT